MLTTAQERLADLAMSLEVYRVNLSPGFYCFGTQVRNGKSTGKILEFMVPLDTPGYQQPSKVDFGFWPGGFAPAEDGPQGAQVEITFPPPIGSVFELSKAAEGFLILLLQHVNETLTLLGQRAARSGGPWGTPPPNPELVAQAIMAMEVYSRTVKPGCYRFYAERAEGEMTGRIIEERREFPNKAQEEECDGRAFYFWPWGHLVEDFADNPVLKGMSDLPQIFEIADLNQAPDSFLESLAQHVNKKTGLNPANRN